MLIINFAMLIIIFTMPTDLAALMCSLMYLATMTILLLIVQVNHLLERDGFESLSGILAVEETHEGGSGALGSLVLGHDQAQGTDLSPASAFVIVAWRVGGREGGGGG